MDISLFYAPIISIILGIIIISGKASFLISGYNTSSREEKEKYDIKALCAFVSSLLFLIAGMLIFRAVTIYLRIANLDNVIVIGFILIIILALVHMNTGNRFKRKD